MDVLLPELDNSSDARSECLHNEISAEGRREGAVYRRSEKRRREVERNHFLLKLFDYTADLFVAIEF